ncbi:MAG: thioredoxin domain-containing protein [Bacteroidia bacterium]
MIAGNYSFTAPISTKPQVLIFLAAKCPCVYSHQETFNTCIKDYKDKIDFTIVFIDKRDDKEDIEDMLKNLGWKVKYIIDKDNYFQKKYQPKVTTDCVLISAKKEIIYHGSVDDSPLNFGQVKNFYLKDAIEDYLGNKLVKVKEGKSIGCLLLSSK